MANKLHDFLSACFTQAKDVIGEVFTYRDQTTLEGIFSAVDGSLNMGVTGYEVTADFSCVADKAQFNFRPREGDTMLYGGSKYQLVEVKEDLSAYMISLKLIGPIPNESASNAGNLPVGPLGT